MKVVKKKQVGDTLNYYFSPQDVLTLWNGYISDVVNGKSIVLSFDRDKNYLLYKLLQKKGDELKELCKINNEKLFIYTEGEKYFYVRIFVPKNKMFYFNKSKGLNLKEAKVAISNIWNQNERIGFHIVLQTFQFES